MSPVVKKKKTSTVVVERRTTMVKVKVKLKADVVGRLETYGAVPN